MLMQRRVPNFAHPFSSFVPICASSCVRKQSLGMHFDSRNANAEVVIGLSLGEDSNNSGRLFDNASVCGFVSCRCNSEVCHVILHLIQLRDKLKVKKRNTPSKTRGINQQLLFFE